MKRDLALYFLAIVFMLGSCTNALDEITESEMEIPASELAGLDSTVTETTDNYTVTYQYRSDAVLYPQVLHNYIEAQDADSVLFLKKGVPAKYIPKAGDVLTARASEALPYGLGCRVVSVEETSDGYRINTCSAALDEIFSELKVSASFLLADTVTHAAEARGITADYNLINIQVDKTMPGTSFKGTLKAGFGYTLDIDISKDLFELSTHLYGNYKLKTGVKIAGQTSKYKWGEGKVNLAKADLKKLQIGPLVMRPHIGWKLYTSVKGEMDAMLDSGLGFDIQAGIRGGKTFIQSNTDFPAGSGEMMDYFTWQGKGTVANEAELSFGATFFNFLPVDLVNTTLACDVSAKLDMEEPNLFKNGSQAEIDVKCNVDITKDVKKVFGNNLIKDNRPTATISLYKNSHLLLPKFVSQDDECVEIGETLVSNRFWLDGGLMSPFMDIRPVMAVYRGDELYVQQVGEVPVGTGKSQPYSFAVERNPTDTELTFCPGISINGKVYLVEGKTFMFESKEPRIEITSIDEVNRYLIHRYCGNTPYNGQNIKFKVNFDIVIPDSSYVYMAGIIFETPTYRKADILEPSAGSSYYANMEIESFQSKQTVRMIPYVRKYEKGEIVYGKPIEHVFNFKVSDDNCPLNSVLWERGINKKK